MKSQNCPFRLLQQVERNDGAPPAAPQNTCPASVGVSALSPAFSFFWSKSTGKANRPFGDVAHGSVPLLAWQAASGHVALRNHSVSNTPPLLPSENNCFPFAASLHPSPCGSFEGFTGRKGRGSVQALAVIKAIGTNRCQPCQAVISPGEAMGVPPSRQLEVGRRDTLKDFPYSSKWNIQDHKSAWPLPPCLTPRMVSHLLPLIHAYGICVSIEGIRSFHLFSPNLPSVDCFCLVFFSW